MSKYHHVIAAKALVTNADGAVLLLRQAVEPGVPGGGQWHMPGGMLEPAESPHDALKREMLEETGLKIIPGDLFDVAEWHVNMRGVALDFVGLFFEATLADPKAPIKLQEAEASEFRWVTAQEFANLEVVEPARSVLKKYYKEVIDARN